MKRILPVLMAALLFPLGALGDVAPCFRYAVIGANALYGTQAASVYERMDEQSREIGTIAPGQHLHVERVERDAGWAYVYFQQDDQQTEWIFPEDCPKGWLKTEYLVFFGYDLESTYVVTTDKPGDRLNLRAKPDADSLSLGKYYAGAVVHQLEAPKNGYMKVRSAHMQGYMDVRFLKKGMEYETNELPILTVSNSGGTGVNLRKLPQKGSEVIQTAPNGVQVTVLSVRDDGWYQIMYENEIGFARADMMTPRLKF